MNAATLIANLLYIYAERMDAGAFKGAADLFAGARVSLGGGKIVEGAEAMLMQWRTFVRLYPCGTPRTRHVVTNPIILVDEDAGTATCRSYYTVLQQTPELPLQAICAGRYHDEFVRDQGEWRFSARDYSMTDLVGDLGQHLLVPLGAHQN